MPVDRLQLASFTHSFNHFAKANWAEFTCHMNLCVRTEEKLFLCSSCWVLKRTSAQIWNHPLHHHLLHHHHHPRMSDRSSVCVCVCVIYPFRHAAPGLNPPVVANCPSSLRVSPRPDPPRHRPAPLRRLGLSDAAEARQREGVRWVLETVRDGSQWRHNPHAHWRDR